jgi:hypothetical protein
MSAKSSVATGLAAALAQAMTMWSALMLPTGLEISLERRFGVYVIRDGVLLAVALREHDIHGATRMRCAKRQIVSSVHGLITRRRLCGRR